MKSSFDTEYKRLNTEQKQAVDAIEGPVMVIAGPGTGKTQILSLRIANILKKTDTSPDSILALTFTESGVQSMRKRLTSLIGSSAYAVEINTFHSFANAVIRGNPESFPHIIGAKDITEIKQISLIEEILKESKKFDILKPFGDPLYYVRAIKSAISELKREGVSTEAFKKIVEGKKQEFENIGDLYYESGVHEGKMRGGYKDLEKQISKNKELLRVYEMYQEKLREQKLYDFEDMIVEVLRVLGTDENLLLSLQENYQYILVDEHQDTNNAQNKILELLASYHAPRPNLFVVGDDKQSIFRFQGASLENFYYFKHLYPEAKIISLRENYRSSQTILDTAHSLLAGEVPLWGNQKCDEKNIDVYSFSSEQVESYFVREDVIRKIEAGVPPHEIAVLYRDNRDAFLFADMFEKAGIPFRIESDQDIFAHTVIRKFLIILGAIESFGENEKLAHALHVDTLEIDSLDAYKLIKSAHQKRKKTLYDIIQDEKLHKELHIADPKRIKMLAGNLSSWVKKSKNTELVQFLEYVLKESGLLKQVLNSPHAQEELDVIENFFGEVRSLLTLNPGAQLKDFFDYLNTLKEHNLFIKKKKTGGREGFVRLMTAHRSKGLEFEYVYVVHGRDGKWGGKKSRELLPLLPDVYKLFAHENALEDDKESDERRLFYVALTRAKKHIALTYARESDDGKEQIPSRFINEIDEKYISIVDTTPTEELFIAKRGEILGETREKKGYSLKDKEFVTDLFVKQGLSVTALNNYLACPWRYFYRNLIRLPEPVDAHLMYGTAVHDTLEYLFKKLRVDENLSKQDVVDYFEKILNTQPMKQEDIERYHERGKEAIGGWYDTYNERWITRTLTELPVRGVVFDENITLTGKIDKLEFLSDSEVNVVDYKTGKVKTRNTILGKTKNADGGLWRQIVFYKILLEKYKDGIYDMVSAEIDFVEPHTNGEYKKEKFTVEQEDVDDLKQIISDSAKEILDLSFWDRRCEEKGCEYCALRDLID